MQFLRLLQRRRWILSFLGLALSYGHAWAQSLSNFTVTPTSVIGGISAKGTITLSAAAPNAGLVVNLKSSTTNATVPASVKVAAAATTATFTVTTKPVATNVTATLTASAGTITKTVTLMVTAPTPKSLTLNPVTVLGGQSSTATLTITGPAPSTGLKVNIYSSHTIAKPPTSVMVAAGQTSATFSVATIPVATTASCEISVADNGVTIGSNLTITAPTLLSFTISPTTVVSGNTASGTVTLTGNTATGGAKIALKSNAAFAQVPSSVTVPAGTNSVTFPITTSYVYPASTATITATFGSKSLTATLTVTPGNPYSTGPWPTYGADAQHTGRSKAPDAQGKLKWSLDFYGGSYSAPVMGKNEIGVLVSSISSTRLLILGLTGNVLYSVSINEALGSPVAGADGTFYLSTAAGVEAISSTGAVKWTCPTDPDEKFDTLSPTVGADGNIYFSSDNFYAITPAGKIKWSVSGLGGQTRTVTGPGGAVYSMSYFGSLSAISSAGILQWSLPGSGQNYELSGLAVGPSGTIYSAASTSGLPSKVLAINPNGSIKWTYEPPIPVAVSAVGPGETVYCMGASAIVAVSSSGVHQWTYNVTATVSGSLTVAANGLIWARTTTSGGIGGTNALLEINPTGGTKWSHSNYYEAPLLPAVGSDGSAYVVFPVNQSVDGYFSSGGCHISHILTTGVTDWTFNGGLPNSAPTIGADGTLYVSCTNGVLRTVHPDGTFGWSFVADSPIALAPTLGADGTAYFGTANGTVYAVTATGAKKWTYKLPLSVGTAPALGSDGSVYVTCTNGTLYNLSLAGTLKWSFATNLAIYYSSPAVGADGTIYFSSGGDNGVCYALHPDGTEVWSSIWGYDATPSIGNDGSIYLGSQAGRALTASGTLKWDFGGTLGYGYSVLPLTGTNFYIDGDGGVTYLNDKYSIIWSYPPNQINPVGGGDGALLSDLTLYMTNVASTSGVDSPLLAIRGGDVVWQLPVVTSQITSLSVGADGTIYAIGDTGLLAIS